MFPFRKLCCEKLSQFILLQFIFRKKVICRLHKLYRSVIHCGLYDLQLSQKDQLSSQDLYLHEIYVKAVSFWLSHNLQLSYGKIGMLTKGPTHFNKCWIHFDGYVTFCWLFQLSLSKGRVYPRTTQGKHTHSTHKGLTQESQQSIKPGTFWLLGYCAIPERWESPPLGESSDQGVLNQLSQFTYFTRC